MNCYCGGCDHAPDCQDCETLAYMAAGIVIGIATERGSDVEFRGIKHLGLDEQPEVLRGPPLDESQEAT